MADIELVIKIPEEIYNKTIAVIYEGEEMDCLIIDTFMCVMANGTPLPKGHGRLIDADELIQDIEDDSQLCYFNSKSERIIHDKMVDYAINEISGAPTIIEADKTESEQ